jgi:hypothetical protein
MVGLWSIAHAKFAVKFPLGKWGNPGTYNIAKHVMRLMPLKSIAKAQFVNDYTDCVYNFI